MFLRALSFEVKLEQCTVWLVQTIYHPYARLVNYITLAPQYNQLIQQSNSLNLPNTNNFLN